MLPTCVLAQSGQPTSQQAKIENKGSNNNIKVIQAGTVVTYNLLNEQDAQKLLDYVIGIPSIAKQLTTLTSEIRNQGKGLKKVLLEIARNTSQEGFISLNDYNKGLEGYILKNKQLEEELAKFKVQNQNTEFATVLAQAEEKLKQLDNEGYQQVFETFKQQRKVKRQLEAEEYAQAAYLQAQNSYNQFQYEKALQQLEEALQYPVEDRVAYLFTKANILRDSYRLDEAVGVLLMLDNQELNDTLRGTVYNKLGEVYTHKGLYDKAIEYHTQALANRLKILGAKHPAVAISYNNLGWVYAEKGAYDKAIDYYDKSLAINLKVSSVEQLTISAIYNNLAEAYARKGEYNKAIRYHTQALAISIKVLGAEHPIIASTYNNLGLVYYQMGEFDKAIEYHTKALAIRQKVFKSDHPDLAVSYNSLGQAYSEKGDYDKATEFHTQALSINIKALGVEHPRVAISYSNLGQVYFGRGEYDKAMEYHTKALAIKLKILEPNHPSVAMSYSNLGETYAGKVEYDKAIEYHTQALAIRIKVLGDEHLFVAASYKYLGEAYDQKNEYDQAIKYYTQALAVYQKVLGTEHPMTQTSLDNLAFALIANGNLTQGVSKLEQVKEFVQTPVKATYFNQVGKYYYRKHQYSAASNFFTLSKDYLIKEKIIKTNELWAIVYRNLGSTQVKLLKKQEAMQSYVEAIRLSKSLKNNALIEQIKIEYNSLVR